MPSDPVTLRVNGKPLTATPGVSLASAMLAAGITQFRRSITGEQRAPLCGMGICFECRVTLNGKPHQRACQITVEDGMEVVTDE